MENKYEKFYLNLYMHTKGEKLVFKHKKITGEYLEKMIETIIDKNKFLKKYNKVIRSTFIFDNNTLTQEELLTNFDLTKTEFFSIIDKFLKSFIITIYFKKDMIKVFLVYFIGFMIINLPFILLLEEYNFISRTSQIFFVTLLLSTALPFLTLSRRYITRRRDHLLNVYQVNQSN
ncbi:hypothetical protein [Mariniplasma anaerobium]|uniref:Uncharacterized protein n=1 Tax=Mariniplasma anaerobium TaxID=2735436 RepID=A0A7U9XV10_9MOLU|nr:hypothetical protein [Mariniplasma anaerobium]BCR36743.1 hypothetical protein MPAN_016360 [Mariniplasma anaerobium]